MAERRVLVALAVAVLVALAVPAAAGAHDSDAPPGAKHTWLPKEDWVRFRWLPYEEPRLLRLLDIDRERLLAWLRNDHRTPAGLAARRGRRDPSALAAALVAPWGGRVTSARLAVLRSRALRTLTQGHLAQHMFFHLFHHQSVRRDAQRIFGVAPEEWRRLRYKGLTPYQIGARASRGRATVWRAVLRRLAADQRAGVRRGWTPAAQGQRMLSLQRARLSWWLDRGLPKLGSPDPDGPATEPDPNDDDQEAVPAGRLVGQTRALCPLNG